MWFMMNDAATEFIKDLNANPDRYPDRVVGIVLGAMLDERLSDTVTQFIQQDEKLIRDSFGHESRIFGNAGSRALLAYFLGLLSKNSYRDITLIQKIRNAFVHRVETNLFDDDPTHNWIDELKIPSTHLVIRNETSIWDFDPKKLPALTTRRQRFIRAIQALNVALFLETASPTKGPCRVPRF